MVKIKLLKGEWEYDPNIPLGKKGGFGQVFVGSGEGFPKVAVKKLHISASDAAHRELRIAEELSQLSLSHIVPVFDAGQDANSDSYFVVMALADGDLQSAINNTGRFSDADAVAILKDIATGLLEVRQLVHRDLKPLNVLRHEGRWKIADFGIARFVEEGTATDTLKECLSAQYAAPEQWNLSRATSATDVYALGCIAHALLTGQPPFNGPTFSDFKRQHTQEPPPTLNGHNARLISLVGLMLRKDPNSRPNIERIITILNGIAVETSSPSQSLQGGLANLAQAGALASEEALRQQAHEAAENTRIQERQNVRFDAVRRLENEVIEPLFKQIQDVAHAERISKHVLRLGEAKLEYIPPKHQYAIAEGMLTQSRWDLIAICEIKVVQESPDYVWSASLLYTDKGERDGYRWYEVLFMDFAGGRMEQKYQPYSSFKIQEVIDPALSRIFGATQLAARPKPIDDEDFFAFQDRWADLLAKAYRGLLARPHTLPIEHL